MPCPLTRFPRSEVDRGQLGAAVRAARKSKKWTQSGLARRVGVKRLTIGRLERGETTPGIHLVRALEHPAVLDMALPVPWLDIPPPDDLPWGFLAHLARRASGQKLREVAEQVGCSIATISDFERNVLHHPRILGVHVDAVKEEYAKALGFYDAAELLAYLNDRDASRWLDLIAERFGRPPLRAALRPSVRPEGPF